MAACPILLFTDFGFTGPYMGMMKAAIWNIAPGAPIIDLMHDAPVFDPTAAGQLLSAMLPFTPSNSIIVAVIDPGVGGKRRAIIRKTSYNKQTRWLVGPDNGLLDPACANSDAIIEEWTLDTTSPHIAPTFHGRDVFASAAATLALGQKPKTASPAPTPGLSPPRSCNRVIYFDAYGNAMTDVDPQNTSKAAIIRTRNQDIQYARIFSDVPANAAFWYVNSIGLVELAVNRGNVRDALKLQLGASVHITGPAKNITL